MTELKIKNGIMKSVFITFDQAFYERILALLDRQNEVGECRRPEVRMVHRRQRELHVGRVGRAVRHQGEGLPEPDDRPVVRGAVFGACGPRRGRGADEESPVGIEVERQFVAVAAPGVEAFARAVAEIEVLVVRAALRVVRVRGLSVSLNWQNPGIRWIRSR